MNGSMYKIITTLTNNLGSPISINGLSNKIKEKFDSGDYKNIYYQIKDLEKEKYISIEKIGNSSIIFPNFNNYAFCNLLSQIELKKKENFVKIYPEFKPLIYELVTRLQKDFFLIESLSIIEPERNQLLNRAEFIIIIEKFTLENIESCSNSDDLEKEIFENEKIKIYQTMDKLEKKYNIKLDFLILNKDNFLNFIESNDNNMIQTMILNQIVLLYPQNYWANIKEIFEKNIRLLNNYKINIGKISELDLVYNLNKYGYKEIGSKIQEGNDLRLELIILSILLSKDARKKEAIPILIKKNDSSKKDLNFELLQFYSKKYGKLEELFAYFKVLNELYKDDSLQYPIKILEELKIIPKKINKRAIKEKLRLYYGKT